MLQFWHILNVFHKTKSKKIIIQIKINKKSIDKHELLVYNIIKNQTNQKEYYDELGNSKN